MRLAYVLALSVRGATHSRSVLLAVSTASSRSPSRSVDRPRDAGRRRAADRRLGGFEHSWLREFTLIASSCAVEANSSTSLQRRRTAEDSSLRQTTSDQQFDLAHFVSRETHAGRPGFPRNQCSSPPRQAESRDHHRVHAMRRACRSSSEAGRRRSAPGVDRPGTSITTGRARYRTPRELPSSLESGD